MFQLGIKHRMKPTQVQAHPLPSLYRLAHVQAEDKLWVAKASA